MKILIKQLMWRTAGNNKALRAMYILTRAYKLSVKRLKKDLSDTINSFSPGEKILIKRY